LSLSVATAASQVRFHFGFESGNLGCADPFAFDANALSGPQAPATIAIDDIFRKFRRRILSPFMKGGCPDMISPRDTVACIDLSIGVAI